MYPPSLPERAGVDGVEAELVQQVRDGLLGRRVIAGLEYGVEGMRAGGRRRIRVAPHLGYGDRGVPGVVPANALLTFDVQLLKVEEGGRES